MLSRDYRSGARRCSWTFVVVKTFTLMILPHVLRLLYTTFAKSAGLALRLLGAIVRVLLMSAARPQPRAASVAGQHQFVLRPDRPASHCLIKAAQYFSNRSISVYRMTQYFTSERTSKVAGKVLQRYRYIGVVSKLAASPEAFRVSHHDHEGG